MHGADDHAQLTNPHLSRPRKKKLHRRDQANGGFRYPNAGNTAPFRGKNNNSNIANPFSHPGLASWTGAHAPPGAPRRGKRHRRPHPREDRPRKRRRGRGPNGFAAVPLRRNADDLLLTTTTCPSSPAPTLASSTGGGGRGPSRNSHRRANQHQPYGNRPPRPQLPLLLPPPAPPHPAAVLCTECRDVRRANARFRDWAWGRLERAARHVLDWSAAVGVGFDAAEEMDWQPEPLIRVLVLRAPTPPPPPPPPGSDEGGGDGGGVGIGPLGRPLPPLPGYWRAGGGSGDGGGDDGAAPGHPGTGMGLGPGPGAGGRGGEDGGLGPGMGVEGPVGGGVTGGGGYYARRPPPPYVMSMMQNPGYHHPCAAWAWGGGPGPGPGPGTTEREGGAPDIGVIASTWYQPREPAWAALTSPESCGDIC
ncbi:hypothetical protein DL768_004349 [Monosporascus sp. mg162]|nr:hypothetical protein DL768_004349 [Monosporascus sp. mg162]